MAMQSAGTLVSSALPLTEVLVVADCWQSEPEAEAVIHRAIHAAAEIADADVGEAELAVMLTDDAGIRTLNNNWRGIDKPTNVLSFPALQPTAGAPADAPRMLGDIAIAYETTRKEADDEEKPFDHHLSHLAVHGFLHLIGYDHEKDDDAEAMEGLEREILAQLGIPDPVLRTGSGWTEMPDSDPIQDNPRDTPNLPAVVKEGEVLRPAADNWLLRAIRTLFGWKAGSVRADLQVVLDTSTPDEVGFSAIERTMLRNILGLHERRIADVMVHRADIVAVKRDIPLGELMSLFESAAHSRLVVYDETLDDPEGIVHIRDLLAFMTAKARVGDTTKPKRKKPFPAGLDLRAVDLALPLAEANIIRKLLYVPPSMRAIDLLAQMQASRIHLALVVDEYGGTDGLVSIEDIVEQIVGEIDDEHDSDEPPSIVRQADDSFIADARASLEDARTMIGEEFVTGEAGEEVETLGGYLVAQVGRLPVRGEVIAGPGNFEIEVLDADPRRVKRLRIAIRKERPAARAPRERSRREAAPETGAPPGQRQYAAGPTRRWSRLAVISASKLRVAGLSIILAWGWKRAVIALVAGALVGAGDGAVQCLAGAVPDLPGRGLADRRRGGRKMARRAGGGDVGLLVRARLFRAGAVLDRQRLPGRCADVCLADAVRGARPAGLSRAVHGARLRAGAPDLDAGCLAGAGARGRADDQRMAARPCADGIPVECLRLRAVGAAGAGADRVADRAVGHDLPQRGDLRQPGRTDRRELRAAENPGSRRWRRSRCWSRWASIGAVRLSLQPTAMTARSSCASCSPTCSRTSNSTTPPRRR